MDAIAVALRQRPIRLRWRFWVALGMVVLAASAANPEWHGSFRSVSTAQRLSAAIALPLSPSEVPAGFRVRSSLPVPGSALSGAVEGYTTTLLGPGAGNRITYLHFGTAAEAKAYVAKVGGKPGAGEFGVGPTCIQAKGQCLAAVGPVVVSGSSHSQCYGSVDDAALERARTLLRAGSSHLRRAT